MLTATARPGALIPAPAAVSATQTLTASDPSQTPGQTRRPHQRIPARAMPEGGQAAVA